MREVHYPSVGSTSDAAQAIAARAWLGLDGQGDTGAIEPVLVWADEQTSGRGRQGRSWASPAGGVYLSLAYPWRSASRGDAGVLPLAAGLAVRDALLERCGLGANRLKIKWPNDVLLDGRKVAGVLCERRVLGATVGLEAGRSGVDVLVVGVGLNREVDPAELGPCRVPAASLWSAGCSVPTAAACVHAIAARLRDRLDTLHDHGWTDSDRAALDAALAWRNERVSYQHLGHVRHGLLLGTHPDGSLRLTPLDDNDRNGEPAVMALTSGDIGRLEPHRSHPSPALPISPPPTAPSANPFSPARPEASLPLTPTPPPTPPPPP